MPENLLIVKVFDELFGFDGNIIEQILKVPLITPIPLASSGIKGISNINGRIATIIDLSTVLVNRSIDTTKQKTRVLTIKCNENDYGLIVDEVIGMVGVIQEHYEEANEDNHKIKALYKQDEEIIQVVNECKAIESLTLLNYQPIEIDRFNQKSLEAKNTINGESDRFLFLSLGKEEFAISLDIAREIIFVPENITPISEAGYGVIGMITLRDKLIVAIDLKKVLSISSDVSPKEQRLLILNYKGKTIALLVDSISEVKDILLSDIEKLPDRFTDSKISSVYKAKKSIVSIINKMFLVELIKEHSIEEDNISENNDDKGNEDMIEVAVFQIANEEFALGIEDVQEIIKYTDITQIPDAPEFIDGVINLRGTVIPIYSLPERLGFEKNINNKSKILVCNIEDEKIGLLVDDVSEIMFIEDKYISKSTSEDALFSDVITLDKGKRVILKINTNNLISKETIKSINLE